MENNYLAKCYEPCTFCIAECNFSLKVLSFVSLKHGCFGKEILLNYVPPPLKFTWNKKDNILK